MNWDDPLNTYQDITHYNNFYEFSEGKEAVAALSSGFKSDPWSVEVSGLVSKPRTFAMEELLKLFPQEDRIYRLRCVEAWSMVIPWTGFPLASLLKTVEPLMDAKYVAFTTLMDPKQFPGQGDMFYPWPYTEGLRLDEAMNDLALLVTGLYGAPLPAQDGAPLRLALPWKYGFKSIKSIVKIELVADATRDVLESDRLERIRLLCQRQSGCAAPALAAEFGAPHRRAEPARNAAVQRLR